ncbi:MAG: SDR family NAD(P)-dependent oxidoreductase [Proteobacteria bacterium]|nr:SDR family NAD(P)-dependent oxidoreductase [Pseudomonadota bacterium]MCP4916607.1 SDR family NAD(P)-dependent oxidoreductase [Pseudomonadota bacterium]
MTGGARGIGRSVAEGLARIGAAVAVVDKRALGEQVVAEIEAMGGRAIFVHQDICLDGGIASAIEACRMQLGPVDILVNNAAEFGVRALVESSEEDWDYTLGTNLRACVTGMRKVLPAMLLRQRGVVLNLIAPSGIAYASEMSASKAALRSLTVSTAAEVGVSAGVSVFGFQPGLVATELVRDVFPQYTERLGIGFAEYVEQTRPNPGYPGLMPVHHCGAAIVHCLVHAERHHGLTADAFGSLVGAGIIDGVERGASAPSDTVNVDRLRESVRATRQANAELQDAVATRTKALRRLVSVFRSSSAAFILIDANGRIASWNPAAKGLFGYSEPDVIGRTPDLLVPAHERGRFEQAVARMAEGGHVAPFDAIRLHQDGSELEVNVVPSGVFDALGQFLGISIIVLDISSRRTAERALAAVQDELRQQTKMAAMGQLAGGVAHDVNNMLQVVLSSATQVLEALGENHEQASLLQDALGAGRRTQALAQQLLTFSRKEPINPEILEIDAVIIDMERLLRRTLGSHIHIHMQLAGPGHRVQIDRGQLEQCVLNLALNAKDAMASGGNLVFETRALRVGPGGDETNLKLTVGEYVLLRVRDDGAGMTPDVAASAFEPFFTTKPVGQGTGMGLATVYGVVHGVSGGVGIQSRRGRGTTVEIAILRARRVARKAREPRRREPSRFDILLVEDEPLVRRSTRRILVRAGYRVLEAESAESALPLVREHHQTIALMITDIVMPGWSGPELAREVAGRYPDIAILFISGYADDPGVLIGYQGFGEVLAKPFSAKDLLLRMKVLLGQK